MISSYDPVKTISLTCSKTLKGKALNLLAKQLGGYDRVLSLSDQEITKWLKEFKKDFEGKEVLYEKGKVIFKQCKEQGIKILFIEDSLYPSRLKQIYNPPLVLYYKGAFSTKLLCLEQKTVSVVGTRKPHKDTLKKTKEWCFHLSKLGFHIISGMALGIDAFSHLGALEGVNGGTTAVLGSGVDFVYPYGNLPLYRQILDKGGTILSEYPPKTKPKRYYFPFRNRIISGLSDVLIMMQAGAKSGALITARYSLENNRDILVYKGEFNSSLFEGNQNLIKEGAKSIYSLGDLLRYFNCDEVLSFEAVEMTDVEKKIMATLCGKKSKDLTTLSKTLMIKSEDLVGHLLHLILKGMVEELPGKRYFKKNPYH